jgi:ABC-type Zn2+ transport system substrate-binding protein/surface adhesin
MEAHNAFAGQGAVVLDIGDDIGALVVVMPAAMEGVEVEIRPTGPAASAHHHHEHGHKDHEHGHDPDGDNHHPHVAVVARPSAGGRLPSLVFPELVEGDYELYEKGDTVVRLRVAISGGRVTEADWPS